MEIDFKKIDIDPWKPWTKNKKIALQQLVYTPGNA